jgi:hypothetical protein
MYRLMYRLQEKDKYDALISRAFGNDKLFVTTLNSAFESFLNLNPRSPEYISLFMDDKLRKGLKVGLEPGFNGRWHAAAGSACLPACCLPVAGCVLHPTVSSHCTATACGATQLDPALRSPAVVVCPSLPLFPVVCWSRA